MYPHTVTALTLLEQRTQTSRTLSMGDFHNYQLPSSHDLRNLVDGATADPRAWLQAQVKVNLPHQLLWVSDPFEEFESRFECRINVTIFDLSTVKLEEWNYHDTRPGITGPCSPMASKIGEVNINDSRIRDFLRSKYGGVLFLRYLAPGESYHW